jgi:hypothetical protein
MAHFALVNDEGFIMDVQVLNNDDIGGGDYPESEPLGQAWQALLGIPGTWLQCSYSGSFRGAYPGIGWTYDATLDEFIAPTIPEETP